AGTAKDRAAIWRNIKLKNVVPTKVDRSIRIGLIPIEFIIACRRRGSRERIEKLGTRTLNCNCRRSGIGVLRKQKVELASDTEAVELAASHMCHGPIWGWVTLLKTR